MATGIVTSINGSTSVPSTPQGTVTVDETGEILNIMDADFYNTGLKVGDHCTFDIIENIKNPGTYFAYNLAPLTTSNPQTITAPYTGDITANVGDVITIQSPNAIVTGNITVNGGKVIVDQNAQINGSVNVQADGVFVARKGGQVMGNINANTGGSLKIVNKGKVMGNVTAQSAGRLIIGNDNGPGHITGAIDIQKIRRIDITTDSVIN